MKRNRVAKLERVVRERPCPECGRIDKPSIPNAAEPDFALLSRAEREELESLIRALTTPPCPRCGRTGHELTRLSDEQLNRILALLRTLLGPELPVPGGGGAGGWGTWVP
ncbi:unnamed protein product [Gemmata massiliana]|uniref:Uncharacterized protein n=1 Tax=Gemmata massiliana TaxID=1210884 RepID=A0A6P2CTL1_9BACT|nr:hypothetical protein [Gemmata massiliana]VTR92488.1 unnamed protein product [Gemmata massiliana]